jgi:hypothetical protein
MQSRAYRRVLLWGAILLLAVPPGLAPVALAAKSASKASARKLCGWIVNPTPGNWSLVDRHGEWVLGSQGGYQAPGLDAVPDLTIKHWVVTNGASYGYGCGCMSVDVDIRRRRISQLFHIEQKPIAVCHGDRRLPAPE